jgi:CBS domain-containing protein
VSVTGLTAKEVMTENVITVRDDASISELVALLTENMITGAPVVGDRGALVGVVSTTDVARSGGRRSSNIRRDSPPDFYLHGWEPIEDEIRSFSVEEESEQVVADIMTPVIFSVSENATFAEMADTMVGGRVHRLIVTRHDKVVGIVTTLDLLRGLRARENSQASSPGDRRATR